MKVLCVEKGRARLEQLGRGIREIVPGARVFNCRSPSEAEAIAMAEGCDVLLTAFDFSVNDYGFGDYGGAELAERIKAACPRTNILFFTDRPEREFAGEFIRLRASGYLRTSWKQAALAEEFAQLRYPAASQVEDASLRPQEQSPRKVVCVAFNSGQLRSLKKLLTRFVPDAELCMAMDRREAQSFVEAEGCDVLLTEIDLYGNGNTDGIRLARTVRERCSRANILFTTVSPAEEYADLILPLRISGLLQNPIQPEELAEEFRNLRYPL